MKLAESTECVHTIKRLSKHSDFLIRMQIAFNENTPAEVLDEMIYDSSEDVLCEIIMNNNTSPKTLITLFNLRRLFSSKYLLDFVKNPNTPVFILEECIEHLTFSPFLFNEILSAIRKNSKFPEYLLEYCYAQNYWDKNLSSLLTGTSRKG